jgi:hypothetical protein
MLMVTGLFLSKQYFLKVTDKFNTMHGGATPLSGPSLGDPKVSTSSSISNFDCLAQFQSLYFKHYLEPILTINYRVTA